MTRSIRRLAARLAGENRRQAGVLNRQAHKELALAPLQPWPENDLTRVAARQKMEKASRLQRVAAQLERLKKKETGLGIAAQTGQSKPPITRQ